VFRAGQGVGTVTKPGLPIPPGEPAINPVPREMMRQAIREVAEAHGGSGDTVLEISIPGGEALAQKTWNPRLGIVNGLSILGTTGIVVPYSCAAWIHAIHRGIDVARALGHAHVAGSVGATSEGLVRALYGLPETALIDMGDFVGGMLKYLRRHPVRRLTIAGGFAKMSKLAQGHLDLHSGRSQVDKAFLAALLRDSGAGPDLVSCAEAANTGLEVLQLARRHGIPLADRIAREARETARRALAGTEIDLDVLVSDREGRLIGRT
jgi:cobalt-precorrin-5B (C1)-methyltransferase